MRTAILIGMIVGMLGCGSVTASGASGVVAPPGCDPAVAVDRSGAGARIISAIYVDTTSIADAGAPVDQFNATMIQGFSVGAELPTYDVNTTALTIIGTVALTDSTCFATEYEVVSNPPTGTQSLWAPWLVMVDATWPMSQ